MVLKADLQSKASILPLTEGCLLCLRDLQIPIYQEDGKSEPATGQNTQMEINKTQQQKQQMNQEK